MPDRLGLPAVIADIAEVAGIDAARVIAAEKGGQEVTIPSEPKEDHWLVELVGMAAARKICAHYRETTKEGGHRGRRLLIPMANVRNHEVMVRAIEAGGTNNRVAALSGKHERTVRRVRAKLRDGGMGPLFD
jgi:hypothetical protein